MRVVDKASPRECEKFFIHVGKMAVEAMLTACPTLRRVNIWNRTTERGHSLQQILSRNFKERCEFEVANDLQQAIHAADVVTACTSSIDPLVRGAWVRPGTHVNLAGAQEIHKLPRGALRPCAPPPAGADERDQYAQSKHCYD